MPKKLNCIRRGFCWSRQLVENVTEIDAAARIMSNADQKALWDFCFAFPSVSHDWLFACLSAYGFPLGFVNLVESVYSMSFSYLSHGGALILLWLVRSRVLQGCRLVDCYLASRWIPLPALSIVCN